MEKKALFSSRVWVNHSFQAATIEIEEGSISGIVIGEKLSHAMDLGDKVIMPGVIDCHVHINEPGNAEWEGFETATRAAAKGGTTTLVDMPLNSLPVVTNVEAFREKLSAAKDKLHVNCGFWGGAVDGNISDSQALLEQGCLGIKVFLSHSGLDEFPNISLDDLSLQMEAMAPYQVPILAHCEFDSLPSEHNLTEYPRSYSEYLKSRPRAWENESIKAFVNLCRNLQCKTHIVHISSADLLPWLIKQKNIGIPLSIETCPHYLLFHAEEIEDGNTLFKCAPPIREKANNQALIQALKHGAIDFLATDHSPAPPNLKELDSGNFQKAWGGISGLQFLLSASWTALHEDLNLEQFIPLLTEKPANFIGFGNRLGRIEVGYQADLCVWDPDKDFRVESSMIEHRHKISPYAGRTLKGKVHMTLVNGQVVYQEEGFKALRKGKFILRHGS